MFDFKISDTGWTVLWLPLIICAMTLVFFIDKWDGHIHSQEGCNQLQKVEEKVYMVNTCTGKYKLIKQENSKLKE